MSRHTLILTEYRAAQADSESQTVRIELQNHYQAEGGSAPPGMQLPPLVRVTQAVAPREAMNFATVIATAVNQLRDPKLGDYVEHELMGILALQEACLQGLEPAFPKGHPQHENYVVPRQRLAEILKYVLAEYRGSPIEGPPAWKRLPRGG